jgi:hypothetical protein
MPNNKKTKQPATRPKKIKLQKADPERISRLIWDDIQKIPKIITTFLNAIFTISITRIKQLPSWLKTRPQYFRSRIKEDRKQKKYRTFHLQKKIKPEPRYIPTSRALFQQTVLFLWKNKVIFIGIMLIYLIIYVVLVRTPFMTDARTITATVQAVFGENNAASIRGNFATLGAVLSTSSTGENAITVSLATLLMSLVYIWAIRQRSNDQKIRIRDAYFQSMAPLLSVVVVLFVISIQLIPLGISSFVYTTARGNNLFTSGFEDLTFFVITVLFGLVSLYWVSSSIMALYAASLQGVYPFQALAIARKLTKFQRFAVFKRVIALPVTLGVIYIVGLLMVIRYAPDFILYITEGFQILILPFVHVYLYKLYRSLL